MIDTQVSYIDERRGTIRGYVAPFGSAENRIMPGNMRDVPGYQGFYLSKRTILELPPNGVWINVDHHWDLHNVGYLTQAISTDDGLACEGVLLDRAAGFVFEAEGRTLPRLLAQGKLYFCFELKDVQCGPDGELLYGKWGGLALTEHPAVPKKESGV